MNQLAPGDGEGGGARPIGQAWRPRGERARGHGLPLARTFLSLRHRDFRFLWVGSFFTSGAQWMQQVTLGWLVYDLTGSALLLGAVGGMRLLPALVAAPVAGVAADRLDRKRLLLGTQLFLAVVALLFALDVGLGWVQVWHTFAFAFLIGIGMAFNRTLRQTLVPHVVPRHDLMNAIALNAAAFNVTRILGPALGGILIVTIGVAGNFFIQSACYLGVALSVFPIHLRGAPQKPRQGETPLQNFLQGLRYVRNDAAVFSLILMGMVPMLFAMPFTWLMPIFAEDVLDIGPEGLGFLLSAMGVGALGGTLTLATLGNPRRRGVMLLGALGLMGVGLMAFSFSRWLPLSLGLLVLIGATQMGYFALNNALIQSLIPDWVRGRVLSLTTLDQGLVPLGSLLAGSLAEGLGAPGAVAVMGALLVLLVALAAIRLPHLRRL